MPGTIKDAVLASLASAGEAGLSSREIAERTGHSVLEILPRVSELRRAGQVTALSEKRPSGPGLRWRETIWTRTQGLQA